MLQSDFADDLPMITGDRIQLQQVILNLLRNASDAMATVHDRPRHLLIRTPRDAERSRPRERAGRRCRPGRPEHEQVSTRSIRRKPTAWVSGSPSAAPLSRDITAVCGRSRTTGQERLLVFHSGRSGQPHGPEPGTAILINHAYPPSPRRRCVACDIRGRWPDRRLPARCRSPDRRRPERRRLRRAPFDERRGI